MAFSRADRADETISGDSNCSNVHRRTLQTACQVSTSDGIEDDAEDDVVVTLTAGSESGGYEEEEEAAMSSTICLCSSIVSLFGGEEDELDTESEESCGSCCLDVCRILTILPASINVPSSSVEMVMRFAKRGRSLNTTLCAVVQAWRTSSKSGDSGDGEGEGDDDVAIAVRMSSCELKQPKRDGLFGLSGAPIVAEPRFHQRDFALDEDDAEEDFGDDGTEDEDEEDAAFLISAAFLSRSFSFSFSKARRAASISFFAFSSAFKRAASSLLDCLLVENGCLKSI